MPGCCCCMPLLHNHLMDSCSYVSKNTLLAAKGGCICTPLTPPKSATALDSVPSGAVYTITVSVLSDVGPSRNNRSVHFSEFNLPNGSNLLVLILYIYTHFYTYIFFTLYVQLFHHYSVKIPCQLQKVSSFPSHSM